MEIRWIFGIVGAVAFGVGICKPIFGFSSPKEFYIFLMLVGGGAALYIYTPSFIATVVEGVSVILASILWTLDYHKGKDRMSLIASVFWAILGVLTVIDLR